MMTGPAGEACVAQWDAPQEALYMASVVDTRFQLSKADLQP